MGPCDGSEMVLKVGALDLAQLCSSEAFPNTDPRHGVPLSTANFGGGIEADFIQASPGLSHVELT